jgi:hypothetical protein
MHFPQPVMAAYVMSFSLGLRFLRCGPGGPVRAEHELQARRGVRDVLVVRAAAVDDEVEVRRRHSRARERAHRGDVRELGSRHVRHAALADAGARRDPLVVGLEERREVGVAEDGRRHALSPADDRCVGHSGLPGG